MTHQSSATSRRSLVRAGGVALASSLLESCIGKIAPFNAACCVAPSPQAEAVDNNSLLIDAHCHIFNGSDLPAKDFLTKVEGEPSVVGDLAQLVEWSVAHTGKQELRVLRRLEQQPNARTVTAAATQQEGYKKARKAILNASAAATASSQPDVMTQIKDRMQRAPDYATYKQETAAHPLTESAAEKDWALVVQNFHYCYEMIQDYLETFMKRSGRCVDLMVAAMVDYDWWLEGGKRPKTPLPIQARVMEQISIMSRGRVHGMVPFDPLREAAYRAGRHMHNFSSLAFVQNAIYNQGCIGVKLYPSMGSAPWNNSQLPKNFWDQ